MSGGLEVAVSRNGWVVFRGNDLGIPGAMYVRFAPDRRGRLRPAEVYIDGEGESVASLQKVNFGPLEAIAHDLAHEGLLDPDSPSAADGISVLASHYNTRYARGVQDRDWVTRAYFDQVDGVGPKRAKRPPGLKFPERDKFVAPGVDGLTDAFLRRLTDAYYYEAGLGRSPAKVIAQEACVSPKTVHKWVALARARNIMAPARKGVAG